MRRGRAPGSLHDPLAPAADPAGADANGRHALLPAILGALAIGLSLGLLGSGGSILTVPVLHYLVGQPDRVAIGGSLLVVGLIAAAGCVPYALHRQVDWRNVGWFGLPGMAGAWLGATLAHWVPGPVQLALFAGVMLLAAWRMLRGGVVAVDDQEPHRLAVVAGGTGVGLLSGLVGVGGGFLIVPALVLLAGVPMVSAVGTSLVVIAMNSVSGFGKYLARPRARGTGTRLAGAAHGRRRRHRRQLRRPSSRTKASPGVIAPAVRRLPRRHGTFRRRGRRAAIARLIGRPSGRRIARQAGTTVATRA